MLPVTINEAMIAGVEFVYFIAFVISIFAVILAFIVYRAKPQEVELQQEQELP